MDKKLRKITVLGVEFTEVSPDKILEYVDGLLHIQTKKFHIVTPNPEIVMFARQHHQFRKVINSAELSLVDGVGVVMAAQLLGKGQLTRFTGVDFIEKVCKKYARKPVKLGFLGGKGRVAEKTVECLLEKYPRLNISFLSDEWTRQGFANARLLMKKQREKLQDADESNNQETINENDIGESIDILFVAFGFPKQEEWITEYLPNIPVKIAIGVGGAFDYLSGEIIRAPHFARALGMEWFFRLLRQPWRIRRQLSLLTFTLLVLQEKWFKKSE